MARKKRGSKAGKKSASKVRVVRSMKVRKPKTKARRGTRGKYTGGK